MTKGHTRGTSYSKKRYDKIKKRNYYAKEVLDPMGPYRHKIVTSSPYYKIDKKKLLEELDGETENEGSCSL